MEKLHFSYVLAFAILYLKLMSSSSASAELVGDAIFSPLGGVASPVMYETVAMRVDIAGYMDFPDRMEEILGGWKKLVSRQVWIEEEGKMMGGGKQSWERLLLRLKPYLHEAKEAWEGLRHLSEYLELTATTRRKRQVGILLGVAASSLLSVGSAILSHAEIVELEKRYRKDHVKINQLVERVNSVTLALRQYEQQRYVADVEDKAFDYLSREILQMTREMEHIVEGFYALNQHRVHPGLVTPEALQEVVQKVDEYVRRHGLREVFDVKSALGHMPITWAVDPEGILVMCHVPLVKNDAATIRRLYKLEAALSTVRGRIEEFETPEIFLSVGTNKEVYGVHTAADLMGCYHTLGTYLCPRAAILHKKAQSCIGALYLRDEEAVRQKCRRKGWPLRELPLVHIGNNTFMVRKGERVRRICQGKAEEDFHETKELTKYQLDTGCQLRSQNFVAFPSQGRHLTEQLIDIKVAPERVLYEDPKDFQSQAGRLGDTLDMIFSDKWIPIEKSEDDEDDFDGSLVTLPHFAGFSLSSVCFLMSLAFCFYCYCRRRKQKRRREGDSATFVLSKLSRSETSHESTVEPHNSISRGRTLSEPGKGSTPTVGPPEDDRPLAGLPDGDQPKEGHPEGNQEQGKKESSAHFASPTTSASPPAARDDAVLFTEQNVSRLSIEREEKERSGR